MSPMQLSITTSIHSLKSEVHDAITHCPGSWKRSIRGLQNAHAHGIRITVKHCIAKPNYRDMPDFVDFIYETFSDDVGLLFCSIDYCGISGEATEAVQVDFKTEGPFIERAFDRVICYRDKEGRSRNVTIADTPLCCVDPYYWGFFSSASKHEISAYAAPTNDAAHKTSLRVPSDCNTFFLACKRCDAEELCPGAWRTACELFGEEAVEPIKFKVEAI